MSSPGVSILAGLVAAAACAAGGYYLFYSPAARRLDGVEPAADNRRRQRLRGANGVALVLLGAGFYVGFAGVDPRRHGLAYLAVWGGVFVLLLVVVALAVADVRMTARLRRRKLPGLSVGEGR